MQLKGLVRFFTFALILICLYQLSFTWFVRNHEKSMEAKAAAWVKKLPTAQSVYPNDKEQQFLYNDSVSDIQKAYYKRLLDSTKETKLAFGLTTYASAKEKELMLGLDLQGGMSVTMEVGLDGLIKSLANYTKDASFNTALNNAVAKKANSSADLISLFRDEYKTVNPTGKLAPLFATRSNGKLKFDASDDATATYLKEQATQAFDNTYRILRTRIDRFGLASPNINPDPNKGIISIELAGVNDKERVRSYLQSTANLQFFEVYTFENKDFQASILAADKAIEASLNGITDTTAKADTTKALANKNPLLRTVQFTQPFQGKNGQYTFPAEIGYTLKKDTATLNAYLALPEVRSKFPANLVFMYGKVESEDPKTKDVLPLYAIKTLDNGTAELEGDHVANAAQDFDERGKVAIKMNMDKLGTSIWGKMTTRNIGKPIAIVLDNIVYSAPNVNDAITTGNSQISGNYSLKTAQDLAQILESGKLPAPAKIVQEQQVGPTLGKASIQGGAMSFGIAFLVIFALMLIYFNTGGWVANIALILNLLFTIGILSALGFTCTRIYIDCTRYCRFGINHWYGGRYECNYLRKN